MQTDEQEKTKRLILGITGASGVIIGIRMLEVLNDIPEIETHLVISPSAKVTIAQETDWKSSDVQALADVNYNYQDIGAAVASGSFETMGMIVVPCSIKSLSAIANSFAADLLSRAADVVLKEGRRLILVVRETPFHPGHINLMQSASSAGAIIFPPMPAFYPRPATIADIVDNIVGRLLSRMGLENDLYMKWNGMGTRS